MININLIGPGLLFIALLIGAFKNSKVTYGILIMFIASIVLMLA